MVGMDPLHEASSETKYFYLPNVAARDQTLLPVLISVKGGTVCIAIQYQLDSYLFCKMICINA